MAKIKINSSVQVVNNISNLGTEVQIDNETLYRWNNAISKWWEVQLEMDKVIKEQLVEKNV